MKIERLLKILFYILNRDCVTAACLAEEFGVSRRTIMRDIDALTLAGIPIYSEFGSKGGYSIHREYKVNEKILDKTNAEYLLLALKSLKDVYGDKKVEETYEKVKHIFAPNISEGMMEVDFSVLSENAFVVEFIDTIKRSIEEKKAISFEYTNSLGKTSVVKADCLHLFYKWYAWYAFVYQREKKSFRMYKVVRMRNVTICDSPWCKDYDVQAELEQYQKTQAEEGYMKVRIQYEKEIHPLIAEYFLKISTIPCEKEEEYISEILIKERDFMAFSILLGFGSKVKVLSPSSFVCKIQAHLEQTLTYYKNGDR